MSEEWQILQEISVGNKSAFRKLYHVYADLVYNLALSYCKNQVDAEEITQDVFTKVYLKAGSFQGKSSVKTWIYRITINTCLNEIKKKSRSSFLPIEEVNLTADLFTHPGVLLENKEKSQLLFQAMDVLPPNQKTAFVLSFVDGLPRKDVAEIMETSLKSVESLLQRSKKNLRKSLEKQFPNRRKS